MTKGKKLISNLEKEKIGRKTAKDEYVKNSKLFFKSDKQDKASYELKRKAMEKSKTEYQVLVDYYNEYIAEACQDYKKDL